MSDEQSFDDEPERRLPWMEISDAVPLLGRLHDMGKNSPLFQAARNRGTED